MEEEGFYGSRYPAIVLEVRHPNPSPSPSPSPSPNPNPNPDPNPDRAQGAADLR